MILKTIVLVPKVERSVFGNDMKPRLAGTVFCGRQGAVKGSAPMISDEQNQHLTTNPRIDGYAIASLVLSILSIILGPFGFVFAIYYGHVARRRIRKDPLLSGDGLALAGLVIGYAFLFLTALMALFYVLLHRIS